jgi:hypothetical protein
MLGLVGCSSEANDNNARAHGQEDLGGVVEKRDPGAAAENSENATAKLRVMNQGVKGLEKIPGDYPMDLVPLYGGSRVTYGEKSNYDGKVIFLVKIESEDDKDAVYSFYKELLRDAKDKEESTLFAGKMYTLAGVVGKYKANFVISNNDMLSSGFISHCNIQVDVIE